MTARSPSGVSCRRTVRLSPEFIRKSLVRSGVNVARVDSSGFAGAWDWPFFVRNAKLTYSSPVLAAQVAFCVVPVTGFSARLKMFIAAHQRVGSQPLAPTATAQVGQGTQPGG